MSGAWEDEALGLGVLDQGDVDLLADPVEKQAGQETIDAEKHWREKAIEDELRIRKMAFTRAFRTGGATLDDVAVVLRVFDKFCRYKESTFHADARLHAVAEGRREVRLLVDDYIELDLDELQRRLA